MLRAIVRIALHFVRALRHFAKLFAFGRDPDLRLKSLPIHPNHIFFTLAQNLVLLPYFGKGVDGFGEMRFFVGGGDLRADTRLALRHDREKEISCRMNAEHQSAISLCIPSIHQEHNLYHLQYDWHRPEI